MSSCVSLDDGAGEAVGSSAVTVETAVAKIAPRTQIANQLVSFTFRVLPILLLCSKLQNGDHYRGKWGLLPIQRFNPLTIQRALREAMMRLMDFGEMHAIRNIDSNIRWLVVAAVAVCGR